MVEPSTSSRETPTSQPGPHRPLRTCVGCREKAARSDLVRVTLVDGHVVIDSGAAHPGRGAWLHRSQDCLALAIKRKAFARAFRTSVADASSLELG